MRRSHHQLELQRIMRSHRGIWVFPFILSLSFSCFASIVFPEAPEAGRKIACENVSRLCQNPNFVNRLNVNDLTITNCHAMYSVGTAAIVSGKLLSAAKMAAWTYLFVQGSNLVAYVTLNVNPTNGTIISSSGVGVGSPSNRVMEGLRVAAQLPQVKKEDYEFRTLQCYAIQFFAVWLHGRSNDIVIPLPPTYDWFNAYQPYSEREIVKVLAPEARRYIATWATLNINPPGQSDHNVYTKAMTDYEKAHGGKCGSISFLATNGPVQKLGPQVEIFTLQGVSRECGKLRYRVKVTRGALFNDVKKVEILEKITDQNP
jgi:hypothetical protein